MPTFHVDDGTTLPGNIRIKELSKLLTTLVFLRDGKPVSLLGEHTKEITEETSESMSALVKDSVDDFTTKFNVEWEKKMVGILLLF